MNNTKIMVTGANGQLGSELRVMAARYPEYEFVFLSRQDLQIHDAAQVEALFSSLQPTYCINCAAYTAVDKAETDHESAFLINGDATGVLAGACSRFGARFIHISTDYVFNGTGNTPYREDDPVDPVNAYGASKRRGEELAMENNPDAIIIRTSWVYSVFGNNFVKTMMRLMKEREHLNVVADQQGSPTYAADLAGVILQIIASGNWVPGIYHYSNEGWITWFDFAQAIKELTGSNCQVHPVATSGFPTPAKRPSFSVMDKEKIAVTYGITIPVWKESLSKCLSLIS